MEKVYMICAALGGTLIVCQFLVTLLGLGGHHDLGGGHDVGGGHDIAGHDASCHNSGSHHDAGHETAPNWFISLLTFRTLTAASAFFGLAGLASIRLQTEPMVGLAFAIGAGALAFFLVGWLMRFMSRLNVDGTMRIERAVGSVGTVYLSIPGAKAGMGKVHVNQLNRTVEYKAITSQDQLPTGAKIVVVSVVNADTVEVADAQPGRAATQFRRKPMLANLQEHVEIVIMIGLAVMVFFMVFLTLATRYKRCPSNRVLIVYGKMTGSPTGTRCLHGGARLVLPLVQDYAYLNLEPIQIEIPLKGALSMENIRVNVPSVFTVAVGTDMQTMQQAAIRLLGLNTEEIKQQSSDIILGQLRQVIASMGIEDINRDREKFLHNIQTSLEPELAKIGLVLINVNITDITDESGYIEAIGRKAASQAVQQAKIDVSLQEKHGQIGVAEAEREKFIQVANATKLREIGTREAQREQAVRLAQLEKEQKVGEQTAVLEREAMVKESQRQTAVRIAELDREQKVGEQTAVLEKEARIKDAERKMRIATADANAKAITGEAAAQAEIAAAQANLQVKQAESYQLGETRKREAEAAVMEAQNRALAKAALADAERVEAEKRAAVEAPAKAEKARVIVEAEAEAEKRRIEAEGQAAATFAKLDAEARGQYEILAKKGEGLRKIIDACGGSQQAFQLLMLEHLDSLAKTAAQAISNIKFDKVVVWEGGGSNGNGKGTSNTTNFLQSMAHSMPPMMQIMKDIGGVELPEFIAKLTPDVKPAADAVNGADRPRA